MNTKNNKRRRESVERIEKAFVEFLQIKELNEISVSEICKSAGINRSTFYANFVDIYDLADRIRENLEKDFSDLFCDETYETKMTGGALKMFRHIKENQRFYSTYFKLGYDNNHKVMIYDKFQAQQSFDNECIDYHIEFFRSGLNAIIKMWLANGCKESPEEMEKILISEHRGRLVKMEN